MQTFLVVDFLQKLCDRGPRFFQIAIFGAVDFLVLEGFDEALGLGIVVRGAVRLMLIRMKSSAFHGVMLRQLRS
jgi:hypothetical protein